jgi:hypothetical protein
VRRYRLFLIDSTGKVHEEREFQATNDAVAVQLANGWRDHKPAELWNNDQRISRWG